MKNDDCPCVFIKKSEKSYCIISVYVDDLNIIGTTQDIEEASSYLKTCKPKQYVVLPKSFISNSVFRLCKQELEYYTPSRSLRLCC